MALSKGLKVWVKPEPGCYSVLLESRSRQDCLLFESGTLAQLTPEEREAIKGQYDEHQAAYGCLGELRLKSGNMRLLFLVLVTGCTSVGKILDAEVYKITNIDFCPLQEETKEEERVSALKKILNSGMFYFSWPNAGSTFDLTVRAQKMGDNNNDAVNWFFWNQLLHTPFKHYQVSCSNWLLKVICGVVEIRTVYASDKKAKACLISRISCQRAGTRFHIRGADDDGHVSNFVETEQRLLPCLHLNKVSSRSINPRSVDIDVGTSSTASPVPAPTSSSWIPFAQDVCSWLLASLLLLTIPPLFMVLD